MKVLYDSIDERRPTTLEPQNSNKVLDIKKSLQDIREIYKEITRVTIQELQEWPRCQSENLIALRNEIDELNRNVIIF